MLDSPSGEMFQCSRLSSNSAVVSLFMRLLCAECVNTVVERRQSGRGGRMPLRTGPFAASAAHSRVRKMHAGCSGITGDGGNVNGHSSEYVSDSLTL